MVLQHVIKNSHGLGLYMIFIQPVECFLSPRQCSEIENTPIVRKKYIQPQTMGEPIFILL